MNRIKEKERLLSEIERKFGIPILVPDDIDDERAIRVLAEIAGENTDTEQEQLSERMIREYLEGRLSASESAATAEKITGVMGGASLALYRIQFSSRLNEDVKHIIYGLTGGETLIIPIGAKEIIVIEPVGKRTKPELLKENATKLADTIAADALIKVVITVDTITNKALELPIIFKNTRAALEIGTRLYPGSRVYAYHELGIGKMIYSMPKEEREEFLTDVLGSFRFASLEPEMQETIRTFFEADLSVTATAGRLYIHRNTLIYRMDKLYRQTGLDLRRFNDAVIARLALQMEQLME